MNKKVLIFTIMFLLPVAAAFGQIYSSGNEPSSQKWLTFSTQNYKLIYPVEMDSLAHDYGKALESVRLSVGASTGLLPNGHYKRPMPVILHGNSSSANGMVTWMPRRMELQTVPNAYGADGELWVRSLAIHESRHVSQLQLGSASRFKLYSFLGGELFSGAMSALYPNQMLLEGDAVVAETGLSNSGRGRQASFLEYYNAAFRDGQYRNWYQWRYGSLRYYVPNHYAMGYMTIAGTRVLYDSAEFTKNYFDNITSQRFGFPMFNLNKTVKAASGKNLRKTWLEIAEAQDRIRQENEDSRAPFKDSERITLPSRKHTEFLGTTILDGMMYSVMKGTDISPRLVKVGRDGDIRNIRAYTGKGRLMASENTGRIYWSETVPDIRWEQKSTSRIRYIEKDGRIAHDLTKTGRYFNPAPSPEDCRIAVCDFPKAGGSAITVLDGMDGHIVISYPAPDSIQLTEAAWVNGRLYASGITEHGYGIFDVEDGYSTVLPPAHTNIHQLQGGDSALYFVCDRNGTDELYHLLIADNVRGNGTLEQMSNSPAGGRDFVIDMDNVYFSSLDSDGRGIYRTALKKVADVNYSDIFEHPWAKILSIQEQALYPDSQNTDNVIFSDTKPYNKFLNSFHIHSWLPVLIDFDSVQSISMETTLSDGGPGATLLFQNSLGSLSGSVGAGMQVSDNTSRGMFTTSFTYSGLYPVIEGKLNIRSNEHHYSYYITRVEDKVTCDFLQKTTMDGNFRVNGKLKLYVPLNFSKGGWNKAIIPQFSLNFSNDRFDSSIYRYKLNDNYDNDEAEDLIPVGVEKGHVHNLTRANASIRAYTMLSTATNGIYPRLGIGTEIGVNYRPFASNRFSPNIYGLFYGYLPGIRPSHGISANLLVQKRLSGIFSENYANVLPSGFSASESTLANVISNYYPHQVKTHLGYALPLLSLDSSLLGPLAYIKNLEMELIDEFALLNGSSHLDNCRLNCAGGELYFRLSNFLWFPYDTLVGISYTYNTCNLWDLFTKNDIALERHRLGMVFKIKL